MNARVNLQVPKSLRLRISPRENESMGNYCLTALHTRAYVHTFPPSEAIHKYNLLLLIRDTGKNYARQRFTSAENLILIVSHGQRITLSVMFNRLPVPDLLTQLEYRILNKLIY